jgi:1,4-dihydroxy-2-naphthoate octaprenyltransferase
LVAPGAVKRAAFLAFGVAAVAGIVLAVAADWRLILVGAACVLAGWLYSGGPKPYASAGLGEVMVLVFFGFVATVGSTYVHDRRLPGLAFEAAVPMGLAASAILLVNNLRDVLTDRVAGKRTLAVRLGEPTTRLIYLSCIPVAAVWPLLLGVTAPGAVVGLLAAPLAIVPMKTVARPDADAPALVGALVKTARFQLALAALLAVGLWDW